MGETENNGVILPAYLPAAEVPFVNEETGEEKKVYRPYGALPLDAIRKHAEQDERGALQELGERYYFGIGGVEQNYTEAYKLLVKAAELGVQDAMYLVAECYRCGHAVEADPEKYLQWAEMAAKEGSWMAMLGLAAAYRTGGYGAPVDHEKALYWSIETEKMCRIYWTFYDRPDFLDFTETQKNILHGHTQAVLQVASAYADGAGVKRNLDEAEAWLKHGKEFVSRITGLISIPVFDKRLSDIRSRRQKEQAREKARKKKKKK